MPNYSELLKMTGYEPMSHRPALSTRYWFYVAAAFIIPVVVQVVFPEDPTLSDELIWLVTLAPAFLLSLHYGLKGAFAALIMGTTLFVIVQLVVSLKYTPDDWRITVPTYIAYGALSISVGWLSEQLHGYYGRVLKQARMATIGQMALTVKHEVNNALTTIMSESQLLVSDSESLSEDQIESARSIHESAIRMARNIEKITKLEQAPVISPVEGMEMLDVDALSDS
jgi:signal transduction histidine kinase